jgi:hypothetical protein
VTVLPFPTQPQSSKQTRRPRKPTKRIHLRQARNMMEGLSFAREIGRPLNTISSFTGVERLRVTILTGSYLQSSASRQAFPSQIRHSTDRDLGA